MFFAYFLLTQIPNCNILVFVANPQLLFSIFAVISPIVSPVKSRPFYIILSSFTLII